MAFGSLSSANRSATLTRKVLPLSLAPVKTLCLARWFRISHWLSSFSQKAISVLFRYVNRGLEVFVSRLKLMWVSSEGVEGSSGVGPRGAVSKSGTVLAGAGGLVKKLGLVRSDLRSICSGTFELDLDLGLVFLGIVVIIVG